MLNRMSKKLTCFFVKKNAINKKDKELYDYCFEILLSTLLNLVTIIIIAICTKTYLTSFTFVIVFMVMRASSGGYHAETHFRCFIILLLVYIGMILAVKLIADFLFFGVFLILLPLIIYPIISPVEHPNNPLDKAKKFSLKIKSNVLSIIFLAASIIMLHFDTVACFGFTILYTNSCVAISCLCAVIKNHIKRPKNTFKGV